MMVRIVERCVVITLLLTAASGARGAPRFTSDGAMVRPTDYREWIFLSSGIDMSYTDAPPTDGHSIFDNVFVDRSSWAAFKRSGHWPDGATFALENRGASSHGSINRHGFYQNDDLMGLEIHVRDSARFKGGWGFFAFSGTTPARQIEYSAQCYACHQNHGAVDTTFTQFYPTAKPIALNAGTYGRR